MIGPIEADIPTIVARVAENLHGAGGDPWIANAVDAAIVYVIDYTDRVDVGLPNDALTVNGVVGFATRIYLDAFSPGGAQVAISDASFEPIFNPEDLYKHWHHYFDRLAGAWGIA